MGRGVKQHCYNTFLKEQNIFKNPYKFFIICYTFRDSIYNRRQGEQERQIYFTANCIKREDRWAGGFPGMSEGAWGVCGG